MPAEDAGHRVESRAERGGRLCAGSHAFELRERWEQVGVRAGIPENQPRIPEYDHPCGTVHGGGRLLLQLPLGREKGGVLLRWRVSPCRVRDGGLGRKDAVRRGEAEQQGRLCLWLRRHAGNGAVPRGLHCADGLAA